MVSRAEILAEIERRKAMRGDAPNVSLREDVVRSGVSGIAEGAFAATPLGMALNIPATIADLTQDLGDWAFKKATGEEPMSIRRNVRDIIPTSSEVLAQVIEPAGLELYQPQTTAGKYAKTGAEFVSGGVKSGAKAKEALKVLAPTAVVSETAGQLTEGTEYEPIARIGAAMLTPYAMNRAGNVGGKMLPKTSKEAIDAQLASGGKVTVGGVLGGNIAPRVEAGLAQAPIIGGAIREARGQVAATLAKRLDDIADMVSPNVTASLDDAGNLIRRSVTDASQARIKSVSSLYDDVFDKIPDSVVADTTASRALIDSLKDKYRFNQKALNYIEDDTLTALTKGDIPARELKLMRPQIKDIADAAAKKEGLGSLAKDLNKVYAQINDDIKQTAAMTVKGADRQIALADAKFKAALDLDDRLTRWIGNKSDEALATSFKKLGGSGTAKTAGGANVAALDDIVTVLPKEKVADLSAYMLRTMGRDNQGALNPVSFADEYLTMNPKARAMLFGKTLGATQKKALDKIADYAQSSKLTLNPAGTAASTLDIVNLVGAGAAIANASVTTVGLALLPYAVSKGMSSQTLARAINKLPRQALNKPLSSMNDSAIRGLIVQAGASPEEAAEFVQFTKDNYAPTMDSNNRGMGNAEQQSDNSGAAIDSAPKPSITRDAILKEIERRKAAGQPTTPAPLQTPLAPQSSISPALFDKIAQAESGGNIMAKNPKSSASGLFQFTDGTWRDVVKKYGAQYGITKEMKDNPNAQKVMMKHLTEENAAALAADFGRQPTDGELYVAHFMGAPKAKKLLAKRGSRELAARMFPVEAKANRPIFFDGKRPRTVQEVISILERKVT